MASEERILHAPEAEVAASASPTSAAGAGAGDTNGGAKAATSGESKDAAAGKASSTASASGKTKSGNNNNNNQHRRKGNYKHHHQNHNQHQHQRQHHKGGNYNNHHRQQYQQRHQNRPGAYVPVNPRPISPPLSMQNPPPPLDLAARRSGLLQALTPQLEYYFSAANLSGDTYLRTLMGLNSGYVPVAAVATFGNVQRIVMRWDGGIPPTASTSPNPEDPLGGPLVRSEEEGVAGFVAAAARTSQVLDVVEIDADGKVVRTVCSADGKTQDEDKGEGENKKYEEKDGSQGNEAKDKKADSVVSDIRIAIGPAGGAEVSKSIATGGSGGTKTNAAKDTPSATPAPTATTQPAPEQTTIILRDAPEATTEKDIRSVFTAANSNVVNVHPDVGNTWFVSLDAKTTSRDDVVSLLLSLRGMKLHGEPIKARLKTESVASRRGTASGGYGYAASAPQSPVTGRPGQFQQHGAGPMASTGGNRAAQPGRGGGGMRPHHMGQSRSVPSSPMAGGRNANYGSGKSGVRGGKNIVALGSGSGNKARRGSRNGDFFKATSSSGNMSSPKGAGTTSKASPSAIPPPPLAGLHFPALGGDNGGNDKTAASQLQHRPKGAAPKDSHDTDDIKRADFAEKLNKDEKPPATKQPAGGYAAALRKAAPAKAVGAEEKKIATTSTAVGPDGKELKLPPSTGGQGPSSRVSRSTTLTDDSSADDKSSVSSKPESIESLPAVTPVAPSWGGGNTFADILKKKQQAAAAAAASTTAEEKNDDKPTEE